MITSAKLLFKTVIFSTVMLSLSGCMVTALKHFDMGNQSEVTQISSESISIEKLLSQARQESPSSVADDNLYLKFESEEEKLNTKQLQTLIRFANQNKRTLFLACAPGDHQNQFIAATVAIRRCLKISTFLSAKSHTSEIMLAPGLQTNQVRVYR